MFPLPTSGTLNPLIPLFPHWYNCMYNNIVNNTVFFRNATIALYQIYNYLQHLQIHHLSHRQFFCAQLFILQPIPFVFLFCSVSALELTFSIELICTVNFHQMLPDLSISCIFPISLTRVGTYQCVESIWNFKNRKAIDMTTK